MAKPKGVAQHTKASHLEGLDEKAKGSPWVLLPCLDFLGWGDKTAGERLKSLDGKGERRGANRFPQ